MKNFALLTGLLCVALTGLHAQSPEQLFLQANELYQQNKAAEAKDLYERILNNGYVNGPLLYNLGNAYYKTGDIPRAILFYERARRWMPADDDLQHNLQLANLKVPDRIVPTPRLFIWDYWDSFKDLFSLQSATWWAYGALVVMFAFGAMLVVAGTYALRKTALYGAGASILIFILFLTLFLAKAADDTRTDEAIVVAAIATIKNSPDAKSSDAFVLHGGVKVRITDRVNNWVKIRLTDGKVGWLETVAIEVI